ncbi:restriction endonuclease subunit S [Ammoniphilus sp. CFH 90114]|uniref:restriction endonuclease subunit S n=1 Tax=Ammoniphilus sp. CFH 90114 TaxID=2493665 RepID=UPI00100F7E43|nr:restriction endonuclease subunit S [Ammoniphilus sp. CFH 90114]RXT08837.1 hypothetical protein EIZ39_08535 [Ammoniphilus sp. CFH 90114]
MKKYKVGQILNRVKETIIIEDDQEYKRLTIRMYHKGVCLRDTELGINIGTKNQFIARSGQFIMSRIDARNGAFGIIPDSIEQAAITNDFLSFSVNEEIVDIQFFELYVQTNNFMQLCFESSKGTTNRKRIKEEVFLGFEVYFPEKDKQIQIVDKVKKLQLINETLGSELLFQTQDIQSLRQSILQEAVQGKLIPQSSNDEPARVLLQKIKAVKDGLLKDKKIKNEYPYSQITDDEKPYEIPQSWGWIRLGELASFIDYRGKTPVKTESGIPLITAKNVKMGFISTEPREYIAEHEYSNWMTRGIPDYGDVIFTTEAPLGNVAQLNIEGIFALAQRTITFKIYSGYYPVFLKYVLMSKSIRESILKKATGTTAQGIKASKLKQIIVPVPPLDEQKRIVEKVDQLMALCDALENTVMQSKQESEMLLQVVLQEVFG